MLTRLSARCTKLGRGRLHYDAGRGVAGYSVEMLGQMKEGLAGSLQQDTAAISPQRCISLYLERLGCTPDAASPRLKVRPPAIRALVSSSVPEAHALAARQQACRETYPVHL